MVAARWEEHPMSVRTAQGFTVTAVVAATLLGAACSKDSPNAPSTPPTPQVTGVSIEGSTTLAEGATSQLNAVASQSDGTTMPVTTRAAWTTSDPTIATISATGLLTALRPGTADIAASFGSQTARRTAQVSRARYRLTLSVQSVTAVDTCDDVTQGLTSGEFAVRVRTVTTSGSTDTVVTTPGYPGDTSQPRGFNLGRNEAEALNTTRSYTVDGAPGEFLRVQFNATEWDEQIVLIPPSIRWVHDSRLDDASTTRTHGFSGGSFSGLGPNSLTLGGGSCGIRLNYTLDALRQ
jgi:hypothetical protein